ncbi:hypothetical protein CRENBAI_001315 [Crenichthys baileyi]|uniref:Leucine-rich repeat-containing protein 19 n=1 Tax=Crenichthys baileyi TaxID=28760 RepID=A0AAV9R614_9TELE
MMDGLRQFLLLLGLSALVVNGKSEEFEGKDEQLVRNLTDKLLQVIPPNANNSKVFMLVTEGNRITLNETDQQALNSYLTLVELHLGGNLVTAVPAKYFSRLSHLRVLSLARNSISSLDPEAFYGLDVLEELDLSSNNLTDLPGKLMTELKSLKILHLQNNPWNCSCPLLNTIGRMKEANVTIGSPIIPCASPAEQEGKNLLDFINLCSTSSPVTLQSDLKSPSAPVTSKHSKGINNKPTTTSTSQNCTISKDQKPVLGNTWKFTVCVAVLALATCALILTAIKGPSWYKRFHNYRHRRLQKDDEEEEQDTVSTVFKETRGCGSQQTFMFEKLSHRIEEEEEEDGYFEDPYIKGAEDAEEEILEAH